MVNPITYLKKDFESVHVGLIELTNKKISKTVAFVYYVLMAPMGLLLLPFVKVWCWWQLRKIKKELESLCRD